MGKASKRSTYRLKTKEKKKERKKGTGGVGCQRKGEGREKG